MTTGQVTVTLSIRLRWWVRPYLNLLAWVAILMDRDPDWEKVSLMIGQRGVRSRVVGP